MPYPEFLGHGKTYLENHRIIAYAFKLNFVNVNKLVTYIVYSYQCSKHTGLKKTNGLEFRKCCSICLISNPIKLRFLKISTKFFSKDMVIHISLLQIVEAGRDYNQYDGAVNKTSWTTINCHALPWTAMYCINCHELAWIILIFLIFLNCHEFSWIFRIYHQSSWIIMKCHESSWIVFLFNLNLSYLIMNCHILSWMVVDCLSFS